MTIKEIYAIIKEIEDHVEETCCAVTMYPEDVIELIEKLRSIIKNGESNENETNGRSNTP